jgi:hypothetical protein
MIVPGSTAFTRIPRWACSIASDVVAAFRPPFVSAARTAGTQAMGVVGEARGYPYNMAAPMLLHLGDGELRDVKEARDIEAQDRRVVCLGLLSEGFADKDAGVVDERIDAPEPAMPSEITRSAVFQSVMSPETTMTSSPLNGSASRSAPWPRDLTRPDFDR